jgi:hypothetical protein
MSTTTPASPSAPTPVSTPTKGPPSTNSPNESEKQFASIVPNNEDRLQLQTTISNISHHDMPNVEYVVTGDADEAYNRFTNRRKMIITAVLSYCGFLAPVSSTTVLSAIPEVAATFHCDGSIINLSNAMYMLFMGISPCFYGPVSNIYGRKWVRFCPIIYLPYLCDEDFERALEANDCW